MVSAISTPHYPVLTKNAQTRYGEPALTFRRSVIQSGGSLTARIELHPPTVRILFFPTRPETTVTLSSQATVGDLISAIPHLPNFYRIWHIDSQPNEDENPEVFMRAWVASGNRKLLVSSIKSAGELAATISDSLLEDRDALLIEHKESDSADWPAKQDIKPVSEKPKPLFASGTDFFSTKFGSGSSSNSYKPSSNFQSVTVTKIPPRPRGTMGLVNL